MRSAQDHTANVCTWLCIQGRVACDRARVLASDREQGSLAPTTPLLLSENRQVDGTPPIGTQPGSGLQVRKPCGRGTSLTLPDVVSKALGTDGIEKTGCQRVWWECRCDGQGPDA